MDTAPLKSFATWARTALIREVTARIAVVLAPASSQRVEQPKAVAALENAITAAGGGDKGRGAVADRVAYTWFNRIIALRFMDANGYTGIGVVSPQAGVEVGQPEILAEAKRANIDPAVVSQQIRDTVTGLLNGSHRSDDPQGEAYGLLLAEYCRHWNRAMPFMFERQGDFTELLMPASLLADDSVLNRAVAVLTVTVCQDVEVIGWLYQFYISERKDEVFSWFKKNLKAGADEIPAATQLFTPHWIVRYLVENSLGRLWMLNNPSSRLIEQMKYYVPPADDEDSFPRVASPEEITVLDPASGSGHMLTYAFDLLYSIYEEQGYTPSDIPGLILACNLYGTEIDPRAGALAAFALTMKARARQRTFFSKLIEPNVCVLKSIHFDTEELKVLLTAAGDRREEIDFWNQFEHADIFGSLIRPRPELIEQLERHVASLDGERDLFAANVIESAEVVINQARYLSSRYSVVVANPPYMGSGNMEARLSEWLADNYPLSKSDLMTAFMDRAQVFVRPVGGYWAMINIPSWMFLASYEGLRRQILSENAVSSLVHLGRGVFGPDFGSVAFVFRANPPKRGEKAVYRRLFLEHVNVRKNEEIEALFLDPNFQAFQVDQVAFENVPGWPLAYWVDPRLLDLYSGSLIGDKFDIKAGVGTRNDDLFMRFHWEVSAQKIGRERRWVLTDKAGEFRKWYAGFIYVMDWEDNGRRIKNYRNPDGSLKSRPQNIQYLFREGVTWGKVGAGATSFRWRPEGYAFNDAAPAIFGEGSFDLLAQLNSDVSKQLVEIKGSTVNVQTGMVAELPIIDMSPEDSQAMRLLATDAVQISKRDWDAQEISPEFVTNLLVGQGASGDEQLTAVCTRLLEGQAQEVAKLFDIECNVERLVRHRVKLPDVLPDVEAGSTVSLRANPVYRYGRKKLVDPVAVQVADLVRDLISYAVGCMFGRYSLDTTGLILADQGDSLHDYLAQVPAPTFAPDADNVIPIVDGDWFEDDIVTRFRKFLRVAFGERYFEENLRFVTESLGIKDLRDYFVKFFYADHLQRYKKRPIYWLFSSPKGSFNALIYMHRYTPSTASTVLNEYLREFKAKLEATLGQQERLAAGGGTPRQQGAAQKEADRIRKMLLELDEYEHDVLYPLASQQIAIDLDDGVRVNYPKFGAALKKIPGLESAE
ncbi:MAG: BREX-1 system adenine-specific DNA-methyltransferase PglX [Fimbriimonadaceae bacterium]|nr:BREX-1 system adenine-specific DNA-methyltransferase PglX [Fimbriimonadaceae bacterium]